MSARVGLQLVPRISLPGVQRLVSRMADMSEPLRLAVKDARDRVALEFRQGVWFMPSGGTRPWKQKKPFGAIPAGRPGIQSGRLFRAWMGGPGGVARVTPRTMTVGVDGNALPYARYFRGGSGANLSLADMVIRPKALAKGRVHTGRGWVTQWSMWWALGLGKAKVWLREATLRAGIRVSPRPHATKHPALVKAVKQRLVDHLKKAA